MSQPKPVKRSTLIETISLELITYTQNKHFKMIRWEIIKQKTHNVTWNLWPVSYNKSVSYMWFTFYLGYWFNAHCFTHKCTRQNPKLLKSKIQKQKAYEINSICTKHTHTNHLTQNKQTRIWTKTITIITKSTHKLIKHHHISHVTLLSKKPNSSSKMGLETSRSFTDNQIGK
jgi:hypothetical protein